MDSIHTFEHIWTKGGNKYRERYTIVLIETTLSATMKFCNPPLNIDCALLNHKTFSAHKRTGWERDIFHEWYLNLFVNTDKSALKRERRDEMKIIQTKEDHFLLLTCVFISWVVHYPVTFFFPFLCHPSPPTCCLYLHVSGVIHSPKKLVSFTVQKTPEYNFRLP